MAMYIGGWFGYTDYSDEDWHHEMLVGPFEETIEEAKRNAENEYHCGTESHGDIWSFEVLTLYVYKVEIGERPVRVLYGEVDDPDSGDGSVTWMTAEEWKAKVGRWQNE